MEFRILGPLDVVERDRSLALGGSRQRALLALLLTRANEVVSAERLIDELWGESPPQNAANALQYHVSQLRKTLAPNNVIVTQEPGYAIRIVANDLDLLRFERLVDEAQRAPPQDAVRLLGQALELWRGPPLVDLAHESFVQTEILRLDELRLRALELRFDAELALGRYAEVVGELEALVRENPLRERLRAALMRALYGAGRQADALELYRQTRTMLIEELGIEPGPELQELERAILRQDPALLHDGGAVGPPRQRAIVTVIRDEAGIEALIAIAEPLARQPAREVILTRLLKDSAQLGAVNAALAVRREALEERGISSRVAAYTTQHAGTDAALLATEHDADLILVDAPVELFEGGELDHELRVILDRAPCDVGVLVGGVTHSTGPVVTPFGGVEHDWSAIEVAAWLAGSLDATLRLLGTEADPELGRRDASRLLARASLLVQQVVGIVTEPVLVRPGEDGVLAAARDARLLVIGLSDRWRSEGIGHVRLAVAAGADVPTLFVRRGVRPGGVEPQHTLTRFTWTVASPEGRATEPKR